MFEAMPLSKNREENYQTLLNMIPYYLDSDIPLTSNLANLSALINYFVDGINWVGFYVTLDEALYLGPFQGQPACTKILLGHGVCGTSALLKETLIVDDVRNFKGHIFCDPNSLSEIVVPIVKNDILIGVLDVDAPTLNRFDDMDKVLFEKLIASLVDIMD